MACCLHSEMWRICRLPADLQVAASKAMSLLASSQSGVPLDGLHPASWGAGRARGGGSLHHGAGQPRHDIPPAALPSRGVHGGGGCCRGSCGRRCSGINISSGGLAALKTYANDASVCSITDSQECSTALGRTCARLVTCAGTLPVTSHPGCCRRRSLWQPHMID
jgi:hypothetical protein